MASKQDFQIGDAVFFVKLVRRNIPTIALGHIAGLSHDEHEPTVIINHGWAMWSRNIKDVVKVEKSYDTAQEELRKRWTERNS